MIIPWITAAYHIGPVHFVALRPAKDFFTHRPSPPAYVTVIHINEDCACVEEEWLKDTIAKYEKLDDVFRIDFLSGVIFTGSPKIELTTGASKLLQSLGVYYVIDEQLHEIWKLYEDSQGAFLTALVPGVDGRPSQFQIGGENIQNIMVAVPSRLQTTAISSHPLGGWRVAVKDIFQIEGVKTSVCNRAFYELYPPASQTAACIRLLEDKGARIIGTTKLAAFAATEELIECVDYQAPWNPRADGYQSPAGSSSGSGVAVASYQWVDIAVGSDTSGSGRRPGHWNGCFAHRPSHGVLPVEGYLPSFEQFDVPTFFGRTVEICKEFAEHWYGDKLPHNKPSLPPAIIYPTEYMSLITNKDQLKIIDDLLPILRNPWG